jgi:hypothetical protein
MALVNDKIIISFSNDLNNLLNIYYYDLDKNGKSNLTNIRVTNKNEIKYLVIEFYHQ